MMLRGLIEEIIRRRLWPVVLIAVLVAAAAPLLFLKSAPDGPAQAALDVPAVPAAVALPAGAQRLLTTTDRAPSARNRPKRGQDPFQAPAGVRAAAAAASKKTAATASGPSTTGGAGGASAAGTSAGGPPGPVAVVITDANGKKVAPKKSSGAGTRGSATTPKQHARTTTTVAVVDVRFSKHGTRQVDRSIPLLKPFGAAGRVIASFVKYSPTRKAAVFAISPGTVVSGVRCERPQGACRYVDIPAGKHARLKLFMQDGRVISRRIDVVHVTLVTASSTAVRAKSPADGACLLGKLLGLGLADPPVMRDACA